MPKGKKKEKEQEQTVISGIREKAHDALRVAKVNKLIEAIILIALGLVLFIWSKTALDVICMVISAMLAILGVVVIVMYFIGRSNVYGSAVGLFAGVVSTVLGLYLFFNPKILESLGPIIIGLIILVTGLVDLSESFRIAKQKSGGHIAALVIAVLEIVFGVIFILHPSMLNAIIMKLMAICLIADGVADIWVMFQIGKGEKAVKQAVDTVEGAVKDAFDTAASVGGNFVDGEAAGVSGDAAEETAEAEKAEAKADADGGSSSGSASSGGYTEIPHRHEAAASTGASAAGTAADPFVNTEKKSDVTASAGKKIPSADDIATEIPPEDGPTRQD